MATLSVGQEVLLFGLGLGGRSAPRAARVMEVGRKYATVAWGEDLYRQDQFDIGTGYVKGDLYGNGARIKTLEQAATDERYDEAKRYLFSVGVDVTYRSALNPDDIHLSPALVEELAAIVKNMLSEKPADYESEIQGKY